MTKARVVLLNLSGHPTTEPVIEKVRNNFHDSVELYIYHQNVQYDFKDKPEQIRRLLDKIHSDKLPENPVGGRVQLSALDEARELFVIPPSCGYIAVLVYIALIAVGKKPTLLSVRRDARTGLFTLWQSISCSKLYNACRQTSRSKTLSNEIRV